MEENVEKATLILHAHVTHGIDDLNEISHAWMVWNQQHLNMTYKVLIPFTKYVFRICFLFFLHVPISLKKILFNIVGHGMDLIVKVLPPMYLSALIFQ